MSAHSPTHDPPPPPLTRTSSSSSTSSTLNIFTEPPNYYAPPAPPTTTTHTLLTGRTLHLSLIGHNPLWGHLLWNSGRTLSIYLESHPSLVQNRRILELGAGAALPSIVSALHGAAAVVASDYPDPDLIANIQHNVDTCLSPEQRARVFVEGFVWGKDPARLLQHLADATAAPSSGKDTPAVPKFDVLILADLLFNHSEHGALLATLRATLAREEGAVALVFFTAYRPWLVERDLAFFEMAREAGMRVEKVHEEVVERVMFEADRGDEIVRRTVGGWEVRW